VAVICPMGIEMKAVAREVRAAGLEGRVALHQSGIGAARIVATVEKAAAGGAGVMVLAGACGGLRPTADVPRIARVVDEHGGVWAGGVGFAGDDPTAVTLVAVDRVVETPEAKRALAEKTGASIVDMESHAFARRCEGLGVRWTVVRGVSDTPEEMLPGEVLGWVTEEGETRAGRAVWDMVRRPRLVWPMVKVLRRSERVLPGVGRGVVEVVRGLEGEGDVGCGPERKQDHPKWGA
jgi:nucleoside phosphorylase